ncbi:hypothetical protein QM012_007663 [Aureobasidium pullulans]|uniref:C2H2-type domain-containing protein n=1 Tax=Aureobasidium pullulans TaxID=5580 RepID=A0ABR0TKW4_AURPU
MNGSNQKQHINSNEDVLMDDLILDSTLNGIVFDNMGINNIDQSPSETSFRTCSLTNDTFMFGSSAVPTAFYDRDGVGNSLPCNDMMTGSTGDKPVHNFLDGFYPDASGHIDHSYATQVPLLGTRIFMPQLSAQGPTSYPTGLPLHCSPQTPSSTVVNYPTPASISPAEQPQIEALKTPTKPGKKARKYKGGNPTKQKKEWPCPHCTRVATCASNLAEHILTHTKVKDYACIYVNESDEICLKHFARPWGLRRHCNDVHKIEVQVKKGGGMRILGPYLGDGSPKGRRTEGTKQTESVSSLAPTHSTDEASSPDGDPHTPLPNIDHIMITTRGPEGACFCADCDMDLFQDVELIEHNHLVHGSPLSSYCSCNLCNVRNYSSETWANPQSTLFDIFETSEDTMEVDAPEADMKIDPRLLSPGDDIYNGEYDMTNTCSTPHAHSSSSLINADVNSPISSPTPVPSISSMDGESPIPIPPPAHRVVDTHSSVWARLMENTIITYTPDGFPVHDCPPVSPTTFYGLMGLDYNNMTDEERRTYLGGR